MYERGLKISLVYKENIVDNASFITAYIKAYDEWLLYFIEKLEQRINTRKKHTSKFKYLDKTHNVFMYENLEEEINFFYQSILEKTPRYPFICIYGKAMLY